MPWLDVNQKPDELSCLVENVIACFELGKGNWKPLKIFKHICSF